VHTDLLEIPSALDKQLICQKMRCKSLELRRFWWKSVRNRTPVSECGRIPDESQCKIGCLQSGLAQKIKLTKHCRSLRLTQLSPQSGLLKSVLPRMEGICAICLGQAMRRFFPIVFAVIVLLAGALRASGQAVLLEEPFAKFGRFNPTGHACGRLIRTRALRFATT
jgi:hypothetical protein